MCIYFDLIVVACLKSVFILAMYKKVRGRKMSKKTRIILCGANGKMGHAITELVKTRPMSEIVAGVDLNTSSYSEFEIYSNINDFKAEADVIIDFSHPSALDDLLSFAEANKLPFVAATTGYSDEQIEKIKNAARRIPVFFTFNMSIGVNLLLDIAKKAVAVLGEQFDIEIVEKHHNQKIDAPSGTAIMLANAINQASDDKYHYEYDRHSKRQKRDAKEIGIHAVRGGTIVGEHEVIFAGTDELISLKHTAMSKNIFAVGAVRAAEFVSGIAPGLYDMGSIVK